MFVEEKTQGEPQPVKVGTLKLSEAIRRGLPIVQENKAKWTMCALGAAFAGVHGRMMNEEEIYGFVLGDHDKTEHAIAGAIGFPPVVCESVHLKHYAGMPASEIADWLESRGL